MHGHHVKAQQQIHQWDVPFVVPTIKPLFSIKQFNKTMVNLAAYLDATPMISCFSAFYHLDPYFIFDFNIVRSVTGVYTTHTHKLHLHAFALTHTHTQACMHTHTHTQLLVFIPHTLTNYTCMHLHSHTHTHTHTHTPLHLHYTLHTWHYE